MKIRTNLTLLYAVRFFHNLIPAYVIERLFWEQRGMTVEEVVYTEMLYAAVILLLEVPTGILADKRGRKLLLLVDAVMGCLEFLLLLQATAFWHFAAVILLTGVGRSASSGAENALLYDSLLEVGREQEFERHLGRLNALDGISAVLAALAGGFLAGRFGLELNYWLSFGSMALSLGATLLLVEPRRGTESAEGPDAGASLPLRVYVRESLRFFRSRRDVALILSVGMVTGASMSFLYEFWQTYLNRLGYAPAAFGFFSSALFLGQLPGSLLAHRLKRRFRSRSLLLAVAAGTAACFAAIAFLRGWAGIAAMLFAGMLYGLAEPLAAGYLHHRTDSAMRATLDSFRSLGENAVLTAAGLGFGFFSARYDIFGGYGFLAAVCGAAALAFHILTRNIDED
ncbi:MFS transporter [Gorillibacterium sp. sgz5001074]|uniref:MFS transporter n=1 Tax=Gorillibacterium sp. sgz5001074 TaxID=3446695 RepID=UPI003F6811C8